MLALLRATFVVSLVITSPAALAVDWHALLGPPSAEEIEIDRICKKTSPDDPAKQNQCMFTMLTSVLKWDTETAVRRVLNRAPLGSPENPDF